MAMARVGAVAVLAVVAWASPATAEIESAPVITDRTRATLVAGEGTLVPGEDLRIGLRLQLKPGWHTYWRNPGDSGEPAAVTLHVVGSDVKGPDVWPMPERIDMAGIVSYGFHGDVVLITTVPSSAALTAKPALQVEAEASWLVCEKVCVPETGRFTLSLPVSGTAPPVPTTTLTPLSQLPPVPKAVFARTGQGWSLRILASSLDVPDDSVIEAYFFPERGDLIDHSAPQTLRRQDREIVLDMTPASVAADPPSELRGVLSVTCRRADGRQATLRVDLVAQPASEGR